MQVVQPDGKIRVLEASTEELCNTSPDFGIKTRCFPFQLHAVAPVATNGWALVGETGKFLPVSQQRISSIQVIPGGGFLLHIMGAPGEVVEMGAADVTNSKPPIYASATIGSDGTALLKIL